MRGVWSSTSAQSTIGNSNLLLLLFFSWSRLFLRGGGGSRSGRGFAFFLLFLDDFGPGSGSFHLSRHRFFFDDRSEHGKGRQVGLHFYGDAGRELNGANMNGVANVESGNVDRDSVGQIARQTFDRKRA